MNRASSIKNIEENILWDIIIIGGGATGLGTAVDAASRGYKVLLLEQFDFAKGTSSRSTKLVHGGVRYLQQGNIKLIKEALQERGLLLQNAPHVCEPIQFVIPVYSWFKKWYYAAGLKLYDFISGKYSLGKTSVLTADEVKTILPTIDCRKLKGGILYFDGQFDDARLAINLAQTAVNYGATIINYCKVTGFIEEQNKISGVSCLDSIGGNNYQLKSTVVINATGVFTDDILKMAAPGHQPIIKVSQGIHIVIDKKYFPGNMGLMIPSTSDGRVLFAVPWHNKVVVGTTDTAINTANIEPLAQQQEINFVLEHINQYLQINISQKNILSVFAGLRPLVKISGKSNTALLPRDHTILVNENGLVTITGGKWTTYRIMAEQVINKAIKNSELEFKKCVTANLKIQGYQQKNKLDHHHHLCCYGADAENVEDLVNTNPSLGQRIHPRYFFIKAQIVWAVQKEMAITVEDFLARRIRLLFLDAKAAIESANVVAEIMATELNKDQQWIQQQVEDFNKLAEGYLMLRIK